VAPAELVQPILPPTAPGYVVSSEFWLYRVSDLPLEIRNCALIVWSYFRNAGSFSACRANRARS
jgi:hypothetical protein